MAKRTTAMTPRDIAWRRLANQHLIGPSWKSPLEVVRRLGAVQSQDYAGGKWAIGLRTSGLTDADVEEAMTSGAIVRTHVLRPTWHFVAATDIRWMLALTGPRVCKVMAPYDRHLELNDTVFARSAKVIAKALEAGELTRQELRPALKRAGIETNTQRLAHIVMRAELDGLICSGARRGKQSTYALLEKRLPAAPMLRGDEAMAELATRYFTTRGPATAQDFAWWSGLSVAEAKRSMEMVKRDFESETIDGRTYLYSGAAPERPRDVVHLLPNYDEYFIGLRDRSAIAQKARAADVHVPASSFLSHLLVVDGQLVGGWKRANRAAGITVDVRLIVPITRRQLRAVEGQARRYEAFLGVPVRLVVHRGG